MQAASGTGQPAAPHRRRLADVIRAALAASLLLAAGTVVTGCAQKAAASSPMQLGTVYISKPTGQGMTAAYLVIQNAGAADRLTSARTSVGGTVTFTAPSRGGTSAMRALRAITIPARSTVRLVPNGPHLLISDAVRMRAGTAITFTLTFARAGTLSVPGVVTNPDTGGSTYFVN